MSEETKDPAAAQASPSEAGTSVEAPSSAAESQPDRAANAASAAARPTEPQRDMSASLPLLLSLAALILAVYAFYMTQQGHSEQDARIQSLAVRVDGIEQQTNQLEHRLKARETASQAQQEAVVRSELDLIAASLARIAPLASGENKATITGMQQLLSSGAAEGDVTVHGTVEAVPLNE